MTSDDERWERDVRGGLSALLDDVRPGQPPVAAVLRKGRVMRLSRRLAVAGGVTVAVAATVVAVPVLRGVGQPPAPQVGKAGVIAVGSIQGRPWRIVVDQKAGRLCAGEVGLRQSCAGLRSLEHLSGLASLSGTEVAVKLRHPAISFGPPVWNALFGIVGPEVTRVTLHLSSGRTVNLQPVAAAGYRWVGLIFIPRKVIAAKAIAYSGSRELGYSVPVYGGELRPGTYYVSWYPPGVTGPVRQGRYIATGGSHSSDAYVVAGPWGYCVTLSAQIPNGEQENCWSPASLLGRPRVLMRFGSPPTVPRWIVGTARPSVAYLLMTLANGRTMRASVAVFSGQGFYSMRIGPGPAIVRWSAYNRAGYRLYGGNGAPDAQTSAR